MKKILYVLMIACVFASCASYKTIDDKKYVVKVEDFWNNPNGDSRYIVKAWRYHPSIKSFYIKTDTLYRIGDRLVISNNIIIGKEVKK